MSHAVLAQLNIAHLRYPLESPQLSEFVANLDRINQLAETSAGFIWRFTGDTEAEQRVFGDNIIVNLSTWTDVKSLHRFVYRSDHTAIMKKRAEWFVPMEVSNVLWWHLQAEPPSIEEAKNRLNLLAEHGAHGDAFNFRHQWPCPV
jgi:hypothetical protein